MGGIFKSLEDAVKGIALSALLGASMPASEAPALTQQQKQEQKQERKLQEAKKDEVPDEATQRFREDQIRKLLAEDYKKKDAASKSALADKLSEGAENPNNDAALRFTYYREAIRASAEALDLNKAFGFAERLSESYNTKDLGFKCEAFNIARKLVKDSEQAASIADSAYELAGSIYIVGDFGSALKIAADGKSLPKIPKDASQKLTELESEIKQVDSAEQILSKMPDDAKANTTVARYTAFRRGKLDKAKDYAKKGNDSVLVDLIDSEISNPDTSESQFLLGKQYFEASKKVKGFEKDEYTMRSAYWLNAAKGRANALMVGDIEKMLKELETAIPKGSAIDLAKIVDLKKDVVKGVWKSERTFIISPVEQYSRIKIPYYPPDEYSVKAVVQRKDKIGGFYMGFSANEKQFGVELDSLNGKRSRLYLIDGKGGEGVPGADFLGAVLSNNSPNTIEYIIKKSNVVVKVDGKEIINWKGDFNRLSAWPDWKTPDSKALVLGTSDASYVIHQLVLTPISGQGRKAN